MASLRRLQNSPFLIACITLPSGRRSNRSTKTCDRRLAQRLADEFQAAADKAREGRLVEAQARKILNDILVEVGQDGIPNETVDSFLHQWLIGKTGNTGRRYAATVENFLVGLRDKKSASLNAIGHTDILQFIESREQAGVAPKTLSVDVRTLGAAFNVARKLGLVLANPVERALAIRPITVSSSQRDAFSPEQVSALSNAAQGDWKTMVLLGYYSGARLSDCANMRWDNVDLVQGVIDFLPLKTQRKNKRVVVPMHPAFLAHLENLAATDRPEGYLCPSLAGKPSCGKNGLSSQFKRIMAVAGIDAQTGPGMGKRQFAKLTFHSLRHSFNSGLANAGVSQEVRMKLTGHSSEAVNAGYTHMDLPGLRSAVEKLPALAFESEVDSVEKGISSGAGVR
ncbi:MAG TPA: site-specific integrase [Candidatus Binatia bacterium]|jgi:integrase|nr:site-specific integrase [Candidatus Binatia bacterium]